MQILLIVLITLILSVIFLFYFYFIKNSLTKQAPLIQSSNKQLNFLKSFIHKIIPPHSTQLKILDLWCGNWKILRFFNSNIEQKTSLVWYDINLLAILYGKLINLLHKQSNIKLYCKNFNKSKIQNFDIIYLYLLPQQLAKIENRIFKNKSSSSIIISNSFKFKNHQPQKIYSNWKWISFFIYQ